MFTTMFIIDYSEISNVGYALVTYVDYPENLLPLPRDLAFLP